MFKQIFIATLIGVSIMTHLIASDSTTHLLLDNGLNVFLVHDANAPLITARTFVRAGSIDEGNILGSGASHYLEHLVAGGTTEKRSENSYKELIATLGGAYNAYTSVDHTSYFINTTPEHTQTAVEILYEWMFFNSFKDLEFERERKVIRKEIEKNEAHIGRKFHQLSSQNFYKLHPFKHPVIGYLDNFNQLSKESLKTYYKNHYVASNMLLVVGGNFDVPSLSAFIEKTFGSQPQLAAPLPVKYPEPHPFSTRYVEKEDKTNVTHISIKFPTTDLYSPDLYTLDLLDYIMGQGDASILHKKLVEEKKLAYSVNAMSYTPIFSTGYFEIEAEIDYQNKDAFIENTYAIIETIKKGHLSGSQIDKAKKQKIAEDVLAISTIEDKAVKIAQSYLYGHTTNFYSAYTENFKKLTKKDLVKTANHYLNSDKVVITVLKPESNPSKNTTTIQKAPQKKPSIETLSNGIKLISIPSDLEKTHIQIMTLGGLRAETTQNNGIGMMISDLLGKGSKQYSKETMQETIEGHGAEMGGSIGNNTLYFTLTCMHEDTSTILPLYLDAFFNPLFDKKDIEETKRQQLKSIKQRNDDWMSISSYKFKKAFYKDHPYSLPINGEENSVKSLSKNDLKTYYHSLATPQNMVITIAGTFDKKNIIKTLESSIEKETLSKNSIIKEHINRPLQTKSSHQTLDIPQDVAGLFVAFDSVSIKDKEGVFKLDLVDSILSGMGYPSGRLHPILRGEGLVYMVHAVNRPGIEKGHFLIYALTSPDKIDRVKTLIFEQIEDIKTKKVSDKEFTDALASMKYYYLDKNDAIESLAITTATDELYGRGFDYSQFTLDSINQLKKEDIQITAKTYLKNPQVFVFQK